uniref:BZIP domain-containing protein n=1 Tax=Acrobeloides nanus TaxID=290746 RepID=A0A914E668_9BILA
MAAPFSGEDFLKRSLFSSIFGLKVRAPKFQTTGHEHNLHQQNFPYDGHDFPSTSRNIPIPSYGSQAQVDYPTSSTAATVNRERSLSEQLAETLLLASPISYSQEERPVNSPRDIYEEIVEECAQIEQQNGQQFDNMSPSYFPDCPPCDALLSENAHYGLIQQPAHPSPFQSAVYQTSHLNEKCLTQNSTTDIQHHQLCQCCQIPTITPEQIDHITEKSIAHRSLFSNGVVSLEEFVKLVIAVVKDAGALNKNDKKKEAPEEILRRKRQQNNEAAARYRKRQREAKLTANEELDQLTERNIELKAELSTLQQEIETLKETFALKNEHV